MKFLWLIYLPLNLIVHCNCQRHYYVTTEQPSWSTLIMNQDAAETYCNNRRSNLATILTSGDFQNAVVACKKYIDDNVVPSNIGCWIGLIQIFPMIDGYGLWGHTGTVYTTNVNYGFEITFNGYNFDHKPIVGDPWAPGEPDHAADTPLSYKCHKLNPQKTYRFDDVLCSGDNIPLCDDITRTKVCTDKGRCNEGFMEDWNEGSAVGNNSECAGGDAWINNVYCGCIPSANCIPTPEPTKHPSNIPTSAPTITPTRTPTIEPTYDPTTNPTTSYPTLTNGFITKKMFLTLDAKLDELDAAIDDRTVWALDVVQHLMRVENYEILRQVDIEIVKIRKGSIDIDYILKGYNKDLLSFAVTNIMNSVQKLGNITIDKLTIPIVSNTILECEYFQTIVNETYYPFDSYQNAFGTNIMSEMEQMRINRDIVSDFSGNSIVKISEFSAGFHIDCDQFPDTVLCFIECKSAAECIDASVIPKSTTLSEINIICEERLACKGIQIRLIKTNVKTLNLLCRSTFSCDSVQIEIESKYDMSINIQCDDDSCKGMSLSLETSQDDINNNFDTKITCYKKSSCDELFIDGNKAHKMNLMMIMYEYSDNIHISYLNYQDIEFICTPPHYSYFMRYDIDTQILDSEMTKNARSTYSGGNFPCEGIKIGCLKIGKCDMIYNKIDNYINKLKSQAIFDDTCIWFEISDLFSPVIECPDGCFEAMHNSLGTDIVGVIIGVSLFLLVIILCLIYRYFRLYSKSKRKGINVQNTMVVVIGIQYYDEQPKEPDFDGTCQDLNGIEHDITNITGLFRDRLNYQCFPEYKDNDDQPPKTEWTKKEITELLEKQALDLSENIIDPNNPDDGGYDSLLFVISGHGYDGNIITSDMKLIPKDHIHRIFSSPQYAKCRLIPRIFIYDSCDGDEQMKGIKKTGQNEQGKVVQDVYQLQPMANDSPEVYEDAKYDQEDSESISEAALWDRGTQNPDYRLAKINAANKDFQSRIDSGFGSHMIYQFVTKMNEHLEHGNEIPFIVDIFKEIQEELGKTKQLPEFTWNNDTDLIRFKMNKSNSEEAAKNKIKPNNDNNKIQPKIQKKDVMEGVEIEMQNMGDDDWNQSDLALLVNEINSAMKTTIISEKVLKNMESEQIDANKFESLIFDDSGFLTLTSDIIGLETVAFFKINQYLLSKKDKNQNDPKTSTTNDLKTNRTNEDTKGTVELKFGETFSM
eukprot:435274_1